MVVVRPIALTDLFVRIEGDVEGGDTAGGLGADIRHHFVAYVKTLAPASWDIDTRQGLIPLGDDVPRAAGTTVEGEPHRDIPGKVFPTAVVCHRDRTRDEDCPIAGTAYGEIGGIDPQVG